MPKIKTSIAAPTRQSPRARKTATYKDVSDSNSDSEDEASKSKKARTDGDESFAPKVAKRTKPLYKPPSITELMATAAANHEAQEQAKRRQQAIQEFLNRPCGADLERQYYQRMQAQAAQKQAYYNQLNAAMNVTYLATQPSLLNSTGSNVVDLTESPPKKNPGIVQSQSHNKPSAEASDKSSEKSDDKSEEASVKTNNGDSDKKTDGDEMKAISDSETDDEECSKMITKFETGYKCMRCLKLYQSKADLKRHIIKIHTDVRNYKCAKCGEVFTSQNKLDKHEMTHGRDKSYVCVQCEMSFYSLETLKRHEKVHEKKKEYPCEECGRIFHEMNKLVLHSAVHKKGDLPFQCDLCDEGFRARGNLKMHVKMVHSGKIKRKR